VTNPLEIEPRSLIQAGYRYALSLTHHPHDAEDLIQQACLQLIRSRRGLVGRSYLFAAVRNLFIDQARRRARLEIESLAVVDDPSSKVDHEKRADDRMEIEVLLSGLRSEEREVLYLNCVEGFSAREIGELIGSPRGTVLSLLSRAKAKLAGKQTHSETNPGSHHE